MRMSGTALKRRALAGVGALARHVPRDDMQLFAFVASPSVRADPWAMYRRLHLRSAVLPTRYGVWVVASHAGVSRVLREPTTSVDESLAAGIGAIDRSGPFSTLMRRTLLFSDPPDHARLRRLVAAVFTPRTLEALRPRTEVLVDAMLQRLRPAGAADLLAELALPLPVAVICELLGVPEPERPRFLTWARQLAPRLDVDLFRDPNKERAGDQAASQLAAFLGELIADPTRRSPDGLISALTAVEDVGDRLDRQELVAMCALLLVAGFETTMNLIANGLLALLKHPEQLAQLRDGNIDSGVAVDELLRFDGPVQLTQRVVLEGITIDGHDIPRHALVGLLLGAANRDPAVFTHPDRLDLTRTPNPHLAFSSGIHHCLGAGLARLEASIAIPAVLRALPGLRLAARPRWRDTFVLRGLTALPVTWHP